MTFWNLFAVKCLHASISKPYDRATAMPTAWGLRNLHPFGCRLQPTLEDQPTVCIYRSKKFNIWQMKNNHGVYSSRPKKVRHRTEYESICCICVWWLLWCSFGGLGAFILTCPDWAKIGVKTLKLYRLHLPILPYLSSQNLSSPVTYPLYFILNSEMSADLPILKAL